MQQLVVETRKRSLCLICLWMNLNGNFNIGKPFLSPYAAKRPEQGLYLHRDSTGEQLHSLPECQVWGLVCGFHQEREANQSLQDEGEPERGPFHQEATHRPASLPQHGPKQTLWVHPISGHTSSEAEQEITYLFLTRNRKKWTDDSCDIGRNRLWFYFCIFLIGKRWLKCHKSNIAVKWTCVNTERE